MRPQSCRTSIRRCMNRLYAVCNVADQGDIDQPGPPYRAYPLIDHQILALGPSQVGFTSLILRIAPYPPRKSRRWWQESSEKDLSPSLVGQSSNHAFINCMEFGAQAFFNKLFSYFFFSFSPKKSVAFVGPRRIPCSVLFSVHGYQINFSSSPLSCLPLFISIVR